MKPKDLRRIFTFAERRPILEDHIFYVPFYYSDYNQFVFPHFSNHFGNTNPVCIEYCSGNGDWIIEKAKLYPNKNWIAVEKRFDRVQKIWSKLKNGQIPNLLIISGEAYTFTHFYLPDCSIEEVYINFPDPWPKTKHVKHRLIQSHFLDEISRVLKKEKILTIVTDDGAYLMQTLALLRSHAHFFPFFAEPYYKFDVSDYGSSWFENLWRKQGRQIHYTQFIKKNLTSFSYPKNIGVDGNKKL